MTQRPSPMRSSDYSDTDEGMPGERQGRKLSRDVSAANQPVQPIPRRDGGAQWPDLPRIG